MNQNVKKGIISELYTDDKKLNYSGNSNHILKLAKKIYEKLYIKETNVQHCHW